MFNVNNQGIRMTSITPFWCFTVNIEHISHLFLVLLLLAMTMYLFAGLTTSCKLEVLITINIILEISTELNRFQLAYSLT